MSMEPVYLPVLAVARTLFAMQGLKFTVHGADNVPRSGGAVMAINHTGYFDFAYAGLAARPSRRLVRFMAKEEVFTHRITGPLMRGMHHIPVDRNAGAASFRAAVRALQDGVIRMASAAGVPILPTVIWGSQRVWTKDHPKRLGRSRIPIVLSVGSPLQPGRRADAEQLADTLRASMTELLHAAQAGYPALTGADRVFLPARLGGQAPTPERAAELDAAEAGARAARRKDR